jgi:hypothetical protein
MKFKIIKNPKYTNVTKVGIELDPDDEILRLFLSGVYLENYPHFIESVAKSTRWGQEFLSINFFDEMNWEAKAELERKGGIKEGQIDIYVYDGTPNNTILDEELIDRIIYDYATELLNVYSCENVLPSSWTVEMDNALETLKNRIDNSKK